MRKCTRQLGREATDFRDFESDFLDKSSKFEVEFCGDQITDRSAGCFGGRHGGRILGARTLEGGVPGQVARDMDGVPGKYARGDA